jgi:hypothetical protein
MDPFADALDAIFTAHGSLSAIYIPAAGDIASVRTIRDQKTEEVVFGSRDAPVEANLLLLRRSQVERPAAGDQIQVGNFVAVVPTDPLFVIMGEPWLDTEGLTWSCEMRPDKA